MNPIKPIISLVIPFYNVEKYIAQCLDSVYNQDIPEEQYEVICVNDASPDNSRNIVLEYQKKHSNLILIEHETNKKLGTARNTGRAVARGKYLWNIDSDDYIQPNVLKRLIDICENNELDILMFNFNNCVGNEEPLNKKYPFPNSLCYNGIDFINKYCLENFSQIGQVWTQIYRIDFLNESNIYSPPINMNEDIPYTYKSLLLANRIMSITESAYVHRINENSLERTMQKEVTAVNLYENSFLSTKFLYQLIAFIPSKEKKIINQFKNTCRYCISFFPKHFTLMRNDELKKFKKICRKNFFSDFYLIKLMSKRYLLIYFFEVIIPIKFKRQIK